MSNAKTDFDKDVASGKVKESHTSWALGYISRKSEGSVHYYKGRYGEGYVKYKPSWASARYHHVTYYIFK